MPATLTDAYTYTIGGHIYGLSHESEYAWVTNQEEKKLLLLPTTNLSANGNTIS